MCLRQTMKKKIFLCPGFFAGVQGITSPYSLNWRILSSYCSASRQAFDHAYGLCYNFLGLCAINTSCRKRPLRCRKKLRIAIRGQTARMYPCRSWLAWFKVLWLAVYMQKLQNFQVDHFSAAQTIFFHIQNADAHFQFDRCIYMSTVWTVSRTYLTFNNRNNL